MHNREWETNPTHKTRFHECFQAMETKIFRVQQMKLNNDSAWESQQTKHYYCLQEQRKRVRYWKLYICTNPTYLEVDCPSIHQELTTLQCTYKTSYCTPIEYPDSLIVWRRVRYNQNVYQSLGNFFGAKINWRGNLYT